MTSRVFSVGLLLTAICVLTAFTGCDQEQTTVVAPDAPSASAQLSKVSAAVHQARKDNAQNPEGPPKKAVDLQLSIATAGLPAAKIQDSTASAETSALVFAGKIEEATRRATAAELELAHLREQVDQERREGEDRLKEIVSEADRKVRDALAQANREAFLRVVSVFAVIGGAITIGGIACAVTGWSRAGIMLIPAGILIGGSGLLWGQVWFIVTVGVGVILCAVAGGIAWAVRVVESRRRAASTSSPTVNNTSTAAETPGG